MHFYGQFEALVTPWISDLNERLSISATLRRQQRMARLATLKPRIGTLNHRIGGEPASDHARGNSSQRGYTYRWQQYRKQWLRTHPLCGDRESGSSAEHSACARADRVTAATDVDHIQRVAGGDDPLFWEPTNHQSLCHSCHSVKTQAEGSST